MPSFKHILFPVDFSEQNHGMAPYVHSMARHYGARVTMLHAAEIPALPAVGFADGAVYNAMDFQGLIDERKHEVESFLKNEFADVPTTRLVLEGGPGARIAEYAEKENVDLIMMPTHGYGPFRRFLIGSITAKVLHDVKCPVWTSAHLPDKAEAPAGYRNIICAVDIWSNAPPLIRWAVQFADEQGARLKLMHAVTTAEVPDLPDVEGGRFRASSFDLAHEELKKLQQEAGTNLETVVEGGEVAPSVRRAAETNPCDLVVIGRGVIHEFLGRMRTNVYSIIREAPCPVISV